MTLRKPFTLMHDETRVPLPILSGTGPRQPAKIVIQSPNRFKSHASFHADSGARSDDVEKSTRATRRNLSSHCNAGGLHTLLRPRDKPAIRYRSKSGRVARRRR